MSNRIDRLKDEYKKATDVFREGIRLRPRLATVRGVLTLACILTLALSLITDAGIVVALAGVLSVSVMLFVVVLDREFVRGLARVQQLALLGLFEAIADRLRTAKPPSKPTREPRRRRPRQPLALSDRIAYTICSEKNYLQVFKPMRADLMLDWNNANARNEPFRRWWITWVRSLWTLAWHVAGHNVSKLIAAFLNMFKSA